MTKSEHFSLEDWADFARNVGNPGGRDAMHGHLEQGCSNCTELHDCLRAVHGIGRAEDRYEPPAATVRLAKALFCLRKPAGLFAQALETVKLLFDSQLAPAAIGVRSMPDGPRKFLFSSGDQVIDLQVAPSHEKNRTVLIGQVTRPAHLGRRQAGLPVLLHRGMQRVAKATTNQLGEFHMEFDGPAEDLSLAFSSDHGATVISLGTLTRTHS